MSMKKVDRRTKKKREMDECMSMKKKNIVDRQKKKQKEGNCMSMNKSGRTPKKKKKKIFDKVTLSHVGKSIP